MWKRKRLKNNRFHIPGQNTSKFFHRHSSVSSSFFKNSCDDGKWLRRWMDLTREDLERIGAKEGDEINRFKWKILSRCGNPEWGEAERRKRRRRGRRRW